MLTFTTQRGIGEGMNISKHCFRPIEKIQGEWYHHKWLSRLYSPNLYCAMMSKKSLPPVKMTDMPVAEPLFRLRRGKQ